ncbi:hypothetical protein BCR32DRAFT_285306 [Anaeromyces robustus]|uniref:Uncharacterized protein n=1 Tax=Anaeromyces robustus TaxID=1754192 RepID=A0A1Y1WP64_9FUNG|nr:hypothetical protein BCR32DRAFT_285306 [Anaeromyces robustus]|eukprot:ORX75310.1 hypothetical protein BCR32DRAFT_285306 [Anaeromyces robustus]
MVLSSSNNINSLLIFAFKVEHGDNVNIKSTYRENLLKKCIIYESNNLNLEPNLNNPDAALLLGDY